MRVNGLRVGVLGKLLLTGLIGGVLMAATALPVVALTAFTVDRSSMAYEDLPEALQDPSISQASQLYANDGTTLITTFYDENRRDVTLDQVPKVVQDAVIAAEDSRFYEHHGVDFLGVIRAMVANSGSQRVQGASTLTMQYVRNVLKSDPSRTPEERDAATAVTPARKVLEIRYALALEKHLSKQEILERYLNIAYFGSGAYGIEAASQTYFSKEPSQLTLGEAATLAGMLQSPESDGGIGQAKVRRTYTLDAMVRGGAITQQQAAKADAEPLEFTKGSAPNDCVAARAGWGFFCDYFVKWWQSRSDTQDLRRGGYKIVTTLDPKIQDTAVQQVHTVYRDDSKFVAPMAVVAPGTGKVLALAVNRTYGDTFDQLVAGGGGLTGYQAGSTFKMFAMLAALEMGQPLNTIFDAPEKLVTHWKIETPGKNNCDGKWCVTNANPAWMDGMRTCGTDSAAR
jgi:membrane peptidoglycan carboxypeptidase